MSQEVFFLFTHKKRIYYYIIIINIREGSAFRMHCIPAFVYGRERSVAG